MIKHKLKKISLLLLIVLIIFGLYLLYQSYHAAKVKTLFDTITVESINVTISTFGENSDYYLTNNKDKIQSLMGQLAKASWDYHGKELGGGYNFSQTISCRLYSDGQDPITINFLKHRLNIYVTIWGEQDYGVYTISPTEGQKIMDIFSP